MTRKMKLDQKHFHQDVKYKTNKNSFIFRVCLLYWISNFFPYKTLLKIYQSIEPFPRHASYTVQNKEQSSLTWT